MGATYMVNCNETVARMREHLPVDGEWFKEWTRRVEEEGMSIETAMGWGGSAMERTDAEKLMYLVAPPLLKEARAQESRIKYYVSGDMALTDAERAGLVRLARRWPPVAKYFKVAEREAWEKG